MTENDQGSTLPTPEESPTPEATPEPAKPEPTGSGRFAVYDNRILQFVGGVVDKRPTKAEAKRAAGHDDVEIREV
jgi:hypothetical protein